MTDDLEIKATQKTLSKERAELVNVMLELHALESSRIKPCDRKVVDGKYILPASWSQKRLWFIDRVQQGSAAYHLSLSQRLRGLLELDALQSALVGMVRRHEPLRTHFLILGDEVVQEISCDATFDLQTYDLRELDPSAKATETKRLKCEEQGIPFDLGVGPLIRGRLIRVADREHVLLITVHHIVADGWSLGIIQQELFELYDACVNGQKDDLAPLPLQYSDYVQWYRRWLEGEKIDRQLEYWRQRLAGAPSCLQLPADHQRPPAQSYRGGYASIELGRVLSGKLKAEAEKFGVSLFMLLLGSWAILLHKLSAAEDVVIGTPIAGRRHPSVERLVGLFVNMLPLRVVVADECRVREFFGQVRDVALAAYENEDLPFERIVEVLRPERRLDRHPIFQVVLAFQNTPESAISPRGLELSAEEILDETAKFDLLISLEERGGCIQGVVNYATDLFDSTTIDRWMGYLKALLSQISYREAGARIHDLELLPESERRMLIEGFNPMREFGQETLIQERFEGQVRLHPHTIAVSCEGESLSYAELNDRANQLAWHLRGKGVGPGQLVGICMDRCLDMVVGLLGVLKAGGAYLPLDPSYPPERLAYMLGDAAPSVVLTQEQLRGKLPQSAASVVMLDSDWEAIGRHSRGNPALRPLGLSSDCLAYVIYTSGSTGKPKGVMVEHRNVVRLFAATEPWFGFTEQDVWTLFHSFAFDFSVWELWGALLHGGRVVIVPYLMARSPQEFYRLVCREGVTVLNQTPSAFAQLIDGQSHCADLKHSLRVVIFGGEALEFRTLRPWVERNGAERPQLINMYGITETTVHVTYRQLSKEEIESERGSVIGRPIPDLKTYLLDRHGRPVPIGVIGEIYVGGAGVARGYLNRPELTAERFLPDPFSADSRARMYKTGDLGRWRADGTIEYLGRNDEQVKIRGFRIELGEIEAQLSQYPQVREAVVLAREDVPGERRLVGYVVPKEGVATPSIESLREHLRRQLPEYMVPSAFVVLEALPLTPNGKLDRRGLPAPDLSSYGNREYEAPQGEVEEILAGIWQELLHLERVGRNDNFFELGGHSLLIVQVMERLRRVGLSAEVRRVFESPTLSGLASTLLRGGKEEIAVPPNLIPPGCEHITPEMLPLIELEQEHIDRILQAVPGGAANIQDIYPLAPLQEGMLFHHIIDTSRNDAYVVSLLLSTGSVENARKLIRALQVLVDRHDILRTAIFWESLPQAVQVVHRKALLQLDQVELGDDQDAEEQMNGRMHSDCRRLDLRRAPLLRLQIASDTQRSRWFLLLHIHHIISDHLTLEILIAELAEHVRLGSLQVPPAAPYRDYVARTLKRERMYSSEVFLRAKLGDVESPTAPFAVLQVHGDGSRIEESRETLEPDLTAQLRVQARALGVSTASVFHAAWGLVVAWTSGRDDVVFGTMLLGRFHGDAGSAGALGLFINTLPLRLMINNSSVKKLIENTQTELINLLPHEHAPLGLARRCSSVVGAAPLFTTLLNFRRSMSVIDADTEQSSDFRIVGGQERTNYPITICVDDLGGEFALTAQTDRVLNPERILDYLRTALYSLIKALKEYPDIPATSLELLPESERRMLIEGFNPMREFGQETLIQERFEGQVRLHPHTIAVSCEGESLSYAELNDRANQLAWHLRGKGVGPGQLVGICMDRCLDMVVGLLGVLKAGGAYLPLDPSYPPERLAYMLGDAAPSVVLTQEQLRGKLPQSAASVVMLDSDWEAIGRHSRGNPALRPLGLSSDCLAYVIYTSGSTGKPKGVMVEHRNVVRLFAATEPWFGFTEQDVWTLFHSFAFDFSVWELWGALLHGGRVVIVPYLMARSPQEFYRLVCREGVTVLNQTPSAFAQLIDGQSHCADLKHSLRVVIFGGEALEFRTLRPWVERNGAERPQLINMYGITETTVHVTYRQLSKEEIESERGSVIGRPIPDLKTYLLDRHGRPVPIGVIGEIYVGGAGVARGYLNRPELTAERFLPDPFSADSRARMYKTGDLGRWRADGTIEYLGRNDEQVKIRGFRIELGEIEAQLSQYPQVREAVVLAREDVPGERRLVGYVVPKEGVATPSIESLREHLRRQLPEYMVPSAFVVLEALPLTPNGKLDRRGLPAPDLSSYGNREYEAPQGEVEEILAGIWQELLHLERVGRNDNFFELGGHSLLGVKLLAQINARIATTLPLSTAFRYPTLAEMANATKSLSRFDANLAVDGPDEYEEGVIPLWPDARRLSAGLANGPIASTELKG